MRIVVALVLMMFPSLVWAQPFCFNFPGSDYEIVLQAFNVPKHGQCVTAKGFLLPVNSPSSGTCCQSSDGTDLSCSITTMVNFYALTDHIDLLLGKDEQQAMAFGHGIGSGLFDVQGAPCTAQPIGDNDIIDY